MKILQIIQREQLRGAEIFACQLSNELIKKGHEVELLVLFGKQSGILPFSQVIHYLEANEKRKWIDFPAYRRLSQLISDGKFDLVQANAGDTLKYASISRKFFRWRAKLAFRNANKISEFLTNPVKKMVHRRLMNEVELIASVSKECMQDFVGIFPELKRKTIYLPIGVDPVIAADQICPEDIRRLPAHPKLLHVAGFMPEKNHKGLLRILKKVLPQHKNACLLLVGEGKLQSEIKELVETMGLSSSVFFLGKRKDVKAIMNGCDLLVLPSLIEGLPGVILESFQQNLPVVAYNVGGIAEVVIDYQTGRLVRKDDEDAFAVAIEDCLRHDNLSITQAAKKLAENNYANSLIADGFITAYAETILN